ASLLTIGITYPVTATRSVEAHRQEGSLTLDTTSFLTSSTLFTAPGESSLVAEDRIAAQWLMRNMGGLPVILEATTSDYQYGGRISAMTGLPTVLGWATPERIMRPGWTELVGQRQEAISTILGSQGNFASIEPLLQQYGVELIYVGPLERIMYGPEGVRKFDA